MRKVKSGVEGVGGAVWGLEYWFGFPPLRGEWRAIDSEAESKADRVAAEAAQTLSGNKTLMQTRSLQGPKWMWTPREEEAKGEKEDPGGCLESLEKVQKTFEILQTNKRTNFSPVLV